jgi:hypothetical protein
VVDSSPLPSARLAIIDQLEFDTTELKQTGVGTAICSYNTLGYRENGQLNISVNISWNVEANHSLRSILYFQFDLPPG